MVECWEKEKSVAMAMAVLRIWHTRPESKKANVGVDAQLCQFEPGTALKRFFINQGFYLAVSFTSPQVYHEKSILEILLLSFPRGVFFSHLFNSLRWYRFFSQTSRWEVLMTTWHASWPSYYPGRSSASACHQSLLRGRQFVGLVISLVARCEVNVKGFAIYRYL